MGAVSISAEAFGALCAGLGFLGGFLVGMWLVAAAWSASDAKKGKSHAHLIDDPHPEFTAAMMADLTGARMPRAEPASPVGGDFAARRSSVHAGASEGAQRVPQRDLPQVDIRSDGIHVPVALAWQGVAWDLDRIHTAALRAMGTDLIPLAGTEAWAESDEAYRERLNESDPGDDLDDIEGYMLDCAGLNDYCFPRARLVPVPVQQEG